MPLPTTILVQYISVLTAALVFVRELFEVKEAREAVFPPKKKARGGSGCVLKLKSQR